RRQTGAQRDGVAFAMLETLDAKLALVGRERRPVHAGNRNERREVSLLARQFLRKLETGTRRGSVGIDLVAEDAEAVFGTQRLVLAAQVRALTQFKREPHGIERRPPDFALCQHLAKQRKAVGLVVAVGCTLVGE